MGKFAISSSFLGNTRRRLSNGRRFVDGILEIILVNELFFILLQIFLEFVPEGHVSALEKAKPRVTKRATFT